jgi:uncharacterized membrane protein YoaK (UPF0700 family)
VLYSAAFRAFLVLHQTLHFMKDQGKSAPNEGNRGAAVPRAKSFVALVLTFTAGFVDIVGAITVYDLFTAHVTGTTVRLGQQLVERNWRVVALAASVVAAFLFGSIVGRVLIEIAYRRRFRRIASFNLVLEGALLGLLVPIGTAELYSGKASSGSLAVLCPLLATLAAAMGLQTATLTRVGPLTIHTTFVTGMMNKFAQLASRWLFLSYDLHSSANPPAIADLDKNRSKVASEAQFVFSIWVLYFVGAMCGTWFADWWSLRALYLPCCTLLVAIAVDQWRPLSLQEEKQQSEE